MRALLHFPTCFEPLYSVYLPKHHLGMKAAHQDTDGTVWRQFGSHVFASRDSHSAFQTARGQMKLRQAWDERHASQTNE